MDPQLIASLVTLIGGLEGWRRWKAEREAHNKLKVRATELSIRYKAAMGQLGDDYEFKGVEDELTR